MSGILDSKSRVLDAIITQEGRRQISSGDLRIEYVSFTDTGTYYAADLASGSADATSRIFLEACNLPQDSITLESDDAGRLKAFANGEGIQVKDGQIIEYSFSAPTSSFITGALDHTRVLTGDEFASTSQTLLASSLQNFTRMQLISTHDRLFEDDGFGLGHSTTEFTIHNKRPIADPTKFAAHIDHLDSLFNDVRLSHVRNFKYLPPINKLDDDSVNKSDHRHTSPHHLGHYRPWGRTNMQPLSYKQIRHELDHFDHMGYCKVVNIDPTSHDNRLLIQFFERHYSQLTKLDVIDYGLLKTGHRSRPVAHIFFVGKLMNDSRGNDKFIHLFTLLFE